MSIAPERRKASTTLWYSGSLLYTGYLAVADALRVRAALRSHTYSLTLPLMLLVALAAGTVVAGVVIIYRWPRSVVARRVLFAAIVAWMFTLFATFVITHPTRRTRLPISVDQLDTPWALVAVGYQTLAWVTITTTMIIFAANTLSRKRGRERRSGTTAD